jgi:ornithine carbamoyltransferase
MKKKDLLALAELSPAQIGRMVERAIALKREGASRLGRSTMPLLGKSVGLLFEKPSTRTRVSFEVAVHHLGGQSLFLSPRDVQLSRGETVADTARTLSRYLAALVVRTFSQETLVELARHASIPVINALSDSSHPCQVLADLVTVREKRGSLAGARMTYLGDGNNVANSLIVGCGKTGIHLVVSTPGAYRPGAAQMAEGGELARASGGSVRWEADPLAACRGADFLYTDVWTSMGQEEESERRRRDLAPWQLNARLLAAAAPQAWIMHCLPAHRGEEITDEMMEHPRSAVWDQAENRLHAQKALLEWIFEP